MLKDPSFITSLIFEPLQTFLIKRKTLRSYSHFSPLRTDNKQYKNEVKSYWNRSLGINVNPVWHLIITSQTGLHDPRYLNQEIWNKHFHKKLNPPTHHVPLISDKNFLDYYIGKQHLPKTVFKFVRGTFFNEENKLIQRSEAEEILFSQKKPLFIKSSSLFQGKNAHKLSISNGSIILQGLKLTFNELLEKQSQDFIIQQKIEQHPEIAEMHPNSLNTLRLFTIRLKSGVHFLSGFIKFGADNNEADNTGNGVICGIDKETAQIYDYGYDRKYKRSIAHPSSGIEYKKFGSIPNFHNAVELCKELHQDLMYHKFAAWDVAISKEGMPIIIELNSKQDVVFWQIINGKPFLGDLTNNVIDDIKHTDTPYPK
jgi:hypothetical protein